MVFFFIQPYTRRSAENLTGIRRFQHVAHRLLARTDPATNEDIIANAAANTRNGFPDLLRQSDFYQQVRM
jgi:hypothetical protein